MPFKKLTNEQRAAVEFSGNLLLTACPGSGKTKTLVSKLAYMVKNKDALGIKKRKIIALTYTNIAADTITDRLLSFGIADKSLWVGTIHSFCLQWIIKPNINFIPRLCKGYVVIDEHERDRLLSDLKEKYQLSPYADVITRLEPDYRYHYSDKISSEYKLVDEYHNYLRNNNKIDFDLILNMSFKLLSHYGGVKNRVAFLIKHILVDEYQDTSLLQYEILKLIINERKSNITLIGDQEQAIYTGLGAEVKGKADLIDYFALDQLHELSLTGCFRSSQRIVDFYKKYQDGGLDIESKSDLKEFKSVVHQEQSIDKSQLSNFIHEVIESHIKNGISAEDIVVLCPSWFDVIQRSKELDKLDKVYSIDGVVVSPIPKNEDNMWLNLVKLVLNEACMENYLRRRRLANTLIECLDECGLNICGEHKQVLKIVNGFNISIDQSITDWIGSIVFEFSRLIGLDIATNKTAKSSLDSLVEATKLRMEKHEMDYRALDLKRFFGKSKGVKITTCHSTKGDEYDVVICTGLLEGKIPHWNDVFVGEQHANYIARRLLYVIGSRAKKHLYMISERGHKTRKGFDYVPTRQL
ncbi:ATP-dependent helicase [Vibrio splendidus]|uniref:UvrD-helicase domain-containing protein n=1 Tax=Vibrio sp. 1-2 (7-a) TaxID=2591010 RepID=UPI0014822B45|nr:ATP-dependent helicase [Vibrio sp. 1-2 (7-a)]NNN56626.1 ATP-dependent helicase [Vibrio sp. 1-2 (7-a)]